jgi:hypothetical protein
MTKKHSYPSLILGQKIKKNLCSVLLDLRVQNAVRGIVEEKKRKEKKEKSD